MDIDPSSPKNGERYPVRWRFQSEETLYLPPNTLAIRPVEGLALRPATTYAMVLLKDVANTNMTFQSMLASEEPGSNRETWSVYAPLRDSSLQLDQIATASVFTTMDPVSEMFELANFINEYQPPEVKSLERRGSFPGLYVEYEGIYEAPNFQSGPPPFLTEGGYFEYGENGDPIVQRTERLRFSMSIPTNTEMPESGWPVVMYGHGTGGDYRSYINSGAAATLARVGIATIGIDQVHHGPRDDRPNGCETQGDPGACVAALFFNFINPLAGRDNVRQSAADFVSLARLLRTQTLIVGQGEETSDVDDRDTDAARPEDDGGRVRRMPVWMHKTQPVQTWR